MRPVNGWEAACADPDRRAFDEVRVPDHKAFLGRGFPWKTCPLRVVGGDGFEPPTPAL